MPSKKPKGAGKMVAPVANVLQPLRPNSSANSSSSIISALSNTFGKSNSNAKPRFSYSDPTTTNPRKKLLNTLQYTTEQISLRRFRRRQLPVYRTAVLDFVLDSKDLECIDKEKENLCFLCQCVPSNPGSIIKCGQSGCKTFYHENCLNRETTMSYYLFFHRDKNVTCFKHFCNRCFAENKRTSALANTSKLKQCKLCNRCYHPDCCPPGAPSDNMICPAHIKMSTYNTPHMPFCFNCARDFNQNERVDCDFCIRSFHKTCGQFIVDVSGGEGARMCSSCQYGYFVEAEKFCHVMWNGSMRPAKIAGGVESDPGYIPVVFLRDMFQGLVDESDVKHIYHGFMIPFTYNDVFLEHYTKKKLKELKYYKVVRSEMSTSDVSSLPSVPLGKLHADFKACSENLVTKKIFVKFLCDESHAQQCDCKAQNGMKCLDRCPNRMQSYECDVGCGPECMNGPKARNPNMTKLDVFQCPVRGRGLRATKDFVKGEPIGEYRGRIMTKDEVHTYMTIFVDNRNVEDHLYYMELGNTGLTINARLRASLTRYANHSCEPNVSVCGITGADNMVRQMLYAKSAIKKGEEITFDYGMDWDEFNKVCRCGSKNCSGYLNGKMQSKMKMIQTAQEYEASQSQSKKDPKPKQRGRKRRNEDDVAYTPNPNTS